MKLLNSATLLGVLLGVSASATERRAAAEELLLIPDAALKRICAFDPYDGSIVDLNFMDLNGTGQTQPRNVLGSGRDSIIVIDHGGLTKEYDFDGKELGTIATKATGTEYGLYNALGGDMLGGKLLVSNLGGLGHPLFFYKGIEIDLDSGAMSLFTENIKSFDILVRENDVLIGEYDVNVGDKIYRYGLDGSFLETLVNSDGVTGIDDVVQMNLAANGDILAAGLDHPMGVYRFDGTTGEQLNYWPTPTCRGVYELGNGNILYTTAENNSGVYVLDTTTGLSTPVTHQGYFNYIELVEVGDITQLDGDFNGDGMVSLADYTVWRNNLGKEDETPLNGGGDGLNGVDIGDYNLWKSHFGESISTGIDSLSAVPEPTGICTMLIAMVGVGVVRMRPVFCERHSAK
ncbi:hypothetical protein [Aeoliella sp.]|uniref:hypothetical protein n=1 Tax=Aeoliella sp. TaxID=2795800 RepID=UPI003CCBD6D6